MITLGRPVVATACAKRVVDGGDVVPIDLDRVPAECLGADPVCIQVPAVHRLAGLTEAVHVDDRRQVIQAVDPGELERLPHRAFGHLRVTAQRPHAVREPIE